MESKETFNYTYSAKMQEEVKAIRKKYLAPEQAEDKMERLRRLDMAVTQKAQAVSLVFGMIGALMLGLGMSVVMTDFGKELGLFGLILGIIVGSAGIVLICLAYPAYNYVIKKQRQKIAPEIIKLTDELMK